MAAAERGIVFAEAAERLQIQPVIVEKDFWVCWMLGFLFGHTEWGDALVFKGGTELWKVIGIIRRLSEDIDRSVSHAALGISEAVVKEGGSRRQSEQWMADLEAGCGRWVAEHMLPAPLAEMGCDVVALEVERAFWEKATILHAEHHRDPSTPMPGRYSRHYAYVAAMASRPEAQRALRGRRTARTGGDLEITVLRPGLGAIRFGGARNIPARAASRAPGGVGTGLS